MTDRRSASQNIRQRITSNATLSHLGLAYVIDTRLLFRDDGESPQDNERQWLVADALEAHIGGLTMEGGGTREILVDKWVVSLMESGAFFDLAEDVERQVGRAVELKQMGRAGRKKAVHDAKRAEGRASRTERLEMTDNFAEMQTPSSLVRVARFHMNRAAATLRLRREIRFGGRNWRKKVGTRRSC